MTYNHFIENVKDDVIEYAEKYGCSIYEALDDWTGDGPNGSFGLTEADKDQVLIKVRKAGVEVWSPADDYNKYEDAEMYPGGAGYNDLMGYNDDAVLDRIAYDEGADIWDAQDDER